MTERQMELQITARFNEINQKKGTKLWEDCLERINKELGSLSDEKFLKTEVVTAEFWVDTKSLYEKIQTTLVGDKVITEKEIKIGPKEELILPLIKMKEKAELCEFCCEKYFDVEKLEQENEHIMLKFQISKLLSRYSIVN